MVISRQGFRHDHGHDLHRWRGVWGKPIASIGRLAGTLGTDNPLCYRGSVLYPAACAVCIARMHI